MAFPETFFWYDLETFGLNPFYDRVAQFAGQRTDKNLNPVGDPVILYCKLSADYIPDPQACLVTGITPQEVKAKGMPECEFFEAINKEFSVSGTCVCGFNSLKFDDEFIRNGFYRNFIDPYKREYANQNSRWDILDLVRATHDLRPEGINWPPKNPETGNPVFKLTELTKANNIDQTGAHDAMVDVNATLAVARLIKEKQPKLFDHYLKMRYKVQVKNLLETQFEMKPVVYTSAWLTNPNGCTTLVQPITPATTQPNSIVCFNLNCDPTPLYAANEEEIMKTPGLFRIPINKVPFLAPLSTMSNQDATRLGLDIQLCLKRREEILDKLPSILLKIRNTPKLDEYPVIDDPDFQIYSGSFFTDQDQLLFETIRQAPPEQKLNLNLKFRDNRCPQMLWRYVCRNYPQTLDADNMRRWKSFAAGRLLSPPGETINDISFVERKIVEKLEDTNLEPKEKVTLSKLSEYVNSLRKFLSLPKA